MGIDPVTLGVAALAVSTLSAGVSYTEGRKEAKRQKGQIAEQQRAATKKRASLIKQQRAQLGGGVSLSSPSTAGGLTTQGTDEVLG